MDLPDGVPTGLEPLDVLASDAPPPDAAAEPDGFVVLVGAQDRIHFLDWGGATGRSADGSTGGEATGAGILLIHGFASTAWSWAPVARRLCATRRTVAMDLRGHGLSDAPTEGYDPVTLAEDVVAVAEGSGLVDVAGPEAAAARRVVLVGHGFGAAVAAWGAAALGPRCAALVLVDGGWEDLRDTGLDPDGFLRETEEPPEVLRSMRTFLADRRGYDPTSWDDDQEHAARASVVELPAGRVAPAIHPHVRAAMVAAMFAYRPVEALAVVEGPILALVAGDDAGRRAALEVVARSLLAVRWARVHVARFPTAGHNLMRYMPAEVTAAILTAARPAVPGPTLERT